MPTYTYTYNTTTTTSTGSSYIWHITWYDTLPSDLKIPCLEYDFLGQLEFEG